jgi:hypothetical protein
MAELLSVAKAYELYDLKTKKDKTKKEDYGV